MKSLARLVLVGCFATLLILATGCAQEHNNSTKPLPPTGNAYVGSATCAAAACHADIYATVQASLHPVMVTPVNGHKPDAPPTLPDNPPAGKTWADIRYVLGGWGWKARFVTQDMQVVTGDQAQWNVQTPEFPEGGAWAAYHTGQATPYDFACFRCHTTGPNETDNTFAQPGVQCEACHGMGKYHAANPRTDNIIRDDSALACAQCHLLDKSQARIVAANGFIASEQQYAELEGGGHAALRPPPPHDPHKGIRRGQVGGIIRDCTSASPCHGAKSVNHYGNGTSPNCVDCHMSRATVSARSVNQYQGDVRTHIFSIYEGAQSQADMFEIVGANTYVKLGHGVTLDFACYSCHKDQSFVGGEFSIKTLDQLHAKAETIHGGENVTGR